MKVRELIHQCNEKIDDDIENEYWIDRFNECLADIAGVMCLEGTDVIDVLDEGGTPLPEQVWNDAIIMCRYKNSKLKRITLDDFSSAGYKIFGGKIILQGVPLPASLHLWYYRMPTTISYTDLDTEPEIPEPFQHILKYYACAKWWQTDEEPENESSYWRDYVDMKNQLTYFMNQKRRKYTDLVFRY